jgi:hypothetical protein
MRQIKNSPKQLLRGLLMVSYGSPTTMQIFEFTSAIIRVCALTVWERAAFTKAGGESSRYLFGAQDNIIT